MWTIRYLALCAAVIFQAHVALAATTYEIEAASNDETFIINGEVYKAQTYCMGWDEGDQVIFVDGSPYGACATAKLFNVSRKSVCKVWCE